MLKVLGALAGLYTLYAIQKGEVYAKSDPWGKTLMLLFS